MKLNLILLFSHSIISHSWIDCISLANSTYTDHDQIYGNDFYQKACSGFPRNYPGRDNYDINTLYTVAVLNRGYFPPGAHPDTTKVCTSMYTQIQSQPIYSLQFPMTRVQAGTALKLWYEMDGHRSPIRTFTLYGTGQPGVSIETYTQMKQSFNLLTDVFADASKCSNVNNDNTICWSYWTVPKNWTPGIYSLVWNWPWDQNSVGDEYNTCFEIEVLAS